MTDAHLDETDQPIHLGSRYTVHAPYLSGLTELLPDPDGPARSGTVPRRLPALEQALRGSMQIEDVIVMTITHDRRSSILPVPLPHPAAITVQTTTLGDTTIQVLLVTNERTGQCRWVFPEGPPHLALPRSARTYRVPLGPAPREPIAMRSLLDPVQQLTIRVIQWVEDRWGDTAEAIAALWERYNRPYGWTMPPFDAAPVLSLAGLAPGRILLLLHGTFSTTKGAFGDLAAATMQQLHDRYEGRVVGFNHPTMSQTPAENADQLLRMLGDPPHLEMDIIAHSRGGLVARELAQRQRDVPGLQIDRAILVGTPNRGTLLADGTHWVDLLNISTALAGPVIGPSGPPVMEGVSIMAYMIAKVGLAGLPGLLAMNPTSSSLGALNTLDHTHPTPTRYLAVAANYEPASAPSLVGDWVLRKDDLIDAFFDEDNDCIVPTAGGYESFVSGATGWGIPIEHCMVRKADAHIHHHGFFRDQAICQQLVDWLSATL